MPFAVTQARFRFYNDNGSITTATAAAAENTNLTITPGGGNKSYHLLLQMQETGGTNGAVADDWQLQYSKNAGAWTNVTTTSANVKAFDSTNLTDGGAIATGDFRLTAGTGTAQAGKISEDGLLDNLQLVSTRYNEILFTIQTVDADLAAGDTLDFRVLYNGATTDVTYSVTPRITNQAGGVTGDLSATLGAVTLAAAAALALVGDLSSTIAPVTLSSDGAVAIQAELNQSIGDITISSESGPYEGPTGDLAVTLDPVTLSADGALPIKGNLGTPQVDFDYTAGSYSFASFTRTGEQGAVDSDGTVDWFAANAPAINGAGYHAYGAVTNLNIRSQELDTWSVINTTAAANTQTGPDGTLTADTITASAANFEKYIYESIGGVSFTAAAYSNVQVLKMGTQRYAQLIFANAANATAYANFDLQLGTKTAEGGGGTGYIIALADGWYLCVLVATTAAVSANAIGPVFIDSGTAARLPIHTGGATTLHVWQIQHLLGNFPDGGPLIRTTTATASIGASEAAISLANSDYTAIYVFDDGSTQTEQTTVSGGSFAHPVHPATLGRGIIRSLKLVAATGIGNITIASAGAVALQADLAKTLAAVTLSSAGAVALQADLAKTLAAVTLSATATAPLPAGNPSPAAIRNVRAIRWAYDCPGDINTSGWTGKPVIITDPWRAKWRASVELAAIQGEANIRTLRSFFAKRKGQLVPFRLAATEGTQNSNTGVTVSSTAAQGATSMSLAGYRTALLDGQFVTVNGQLLCLTADQSGASISFRPPLRQQATAGTTVVTQRPYAFVYMASASLGYSVGRARLFGASFDVEEAIRETDPDTVPEA